MGIATGLRNLLLAEFNTQKGGAAYTNNNFTVESKWIPYLELEDLKKDYPDGLLTLVCKAHTSERTARDNVSILDVPIDMNFKVFLADKEPSTVDAFVDLVEELRDTMRVDFDEANYAYIRDEPLTDDNGTVMSYITFKDSQIFEIVISAFYRYVQTGR